MTSFGLNHWNTYIVMKTSLIMHKFSKSLWFFLATMLLICRRGRGARESGKVGTLVSQKSQQGNYKLSENTTGLMKQRFFRMFGEEYTFRTTDICLGDQMTIIVIVCK